MKIDTLKQIIKLLNIDKDNFEAIGIKYENTQYNALLEVINAMHKLAKTINIKEG